MKIVILGGGTAGFFTALYCQKVFANSDITVIRNKEIGLTGVGEATTPPLTSFLQFLDIDPLKFMKAVGGSIKTGISFENWNGDGKKYYHGFREKGIMNSFSVPPHFTHDCLEYYQRHLISKKLDFNEYTYSASLAYDNLVDLDHVDYALHFDAIKVANLLEEISIQRNIKIVEGTFSGVETDSSGFIKKIILEDTKLDLDFVFDCSGFSRLLIGKHFNTKWNSYKEYLPMKAAIPFQLAPNTNIKPYTTATSMPHGWMWQIPLQDRIGAGYVFDSDYITPEEAQREAEKFLGQKLTVPRVLNFEAGGYEKVWVKNCMALGISSYFVEPLESTSIHLTLAQLRIMSQFVNSIYDHNEQSVNSFNKIISDNMEQILFFIYLHYIVKRDDTEFWKNFKKNYPPPNQFKSIIECIKNNNMRFFDIIPISNNEAFSLYSYFIVANGLEMFEKDISIKGFENLIPSISEYKIMLEERKKQAISANEIFNRIQL